MKVIKVEVFLVGAAWRNFTLVKIETDSGIVGWGEGTLGWKETAVRELYEVFPAAISSAKIHSILNRSGSSSIDRAQHWPGHVLRDGGD